MHLHEIHVLGVDHALADEPRRGTSRAARARTARRTRMIGIVRVLPVCTSVRPRSARRACRSRRASRRTRTRSARTSPCARRSGGSEADVLVGVAALLVRQLMLRPTRGRRARERALVGRFHDARDRRRRSPRSPASDSWRAMSLGERVVRMIGRACARCRRSRPRGGPGRRSVASTNSDIIPNTRHASRALYARESSARGRRASGSLSSAAFLSLGHPCRTSAGAGRRLVLSVSRLPRAARPAQPGGRADRRDPRRAEHAAPAGRTTTRRIILGCVFDAKGKTFRDDMYPEYKANRAGDARRPRAQIEPLTRRSARSAGRCSMVDGVEADDVIGTLARAGASARHATRSISTGDKDLAQLVDAAASR